jgi:F-type H+-transporting ATPase subunit a
MVISNKPLKFILVALVAILPFVSFANPTEEKEVTPTESTDVKSEIKEFINHHLLDAHDFTFNADKESGEHNGFSLPIILWDNGLPR